jgi:hypothetical protein
LQALSVAPARQTGRALWRMWPSPAVCCSLSSSCTFLLFSSFNGPNGISIDSDNNLYIAELDGAKIRKITPSGLVSTAFGNTFKMCVNGRGTESSFAGPFGMSVDSGRLLCVRVPLCASYV